MSEQKAPEWKPSLPRFMAVVEVMNERGRKRQYRVYDYEIKPLIEKVRNIPLDEKFSSVKYYYFRVFGPCLAEWEEIDKNEIRKLQDEGDNRN